MAINFNKITIEALKAINIDDLLDLSVERSCFSYASFFDKASQEEDTHPDQQECLVFLTDICQMHLKSGNHAKPYGPMFVFDGRRSAIPEDFPKEVLANIYDWVITLSDSELKARLLDIIWIQTRIFSAAELSVDAYINSALQLIDPTNWNLGYERIERGLRLAASLGRSHIEPKNKILGAINDMVSKYRGTDPLYLTSRLSKLLIEFKYGDFMILGNWNCAGAEKALLEKDFWRAQSYFLTASDCFRVAGNSDLQVKMKLEAAESLVKEAQFASEIRGDLLAAASVLADAIDAMRQIKGGKSRADELHDQLLELQQESTKQMGSIATEFDCTDIVREAVSSLKGKSIRDALGIFTRCLVTPGTEELKTKVIETAKANPIQALINIDIVNGRGKVVAKASSLEESNGDIKHSGLRYRMFQEAMNLRHFYTHSVINPMRIELDDRYHISKQDILDLIRYCPFIKDRRNSVAEAIVAGFQGDLVAAAHMIPLQFESFIRQVVEFNKGKTSSINSDGVQLEKTLNQLLEMPEARQVFGDNGIFELQDLLVDTLGANIRNEVAHSLLDDGRLFGADVLYLWWLFFKYCLRTSELIQKHVVKVNKAAAIKS